MSRYVIMVNKNSMSYKFESDDGIDAIIFVEKDQLDRETFKQIENMVRNPTFRHCRIMPDCHLGTGCCVGFTCHLTNLIIPRIIGGDIGCGVAMYQIVDHRFKPGKYEHKLNKLIHNLIPIGNGHDMIHKKPIIEEEQYAHFMKMTRAAAIKFSEKYQEKFGIDLLPHIPDYSIDWMKSLCRRIGSDYNYDLRSMGSLGGGNHFIEVGEDPLDTKPTIYLSVHTGSRNIGKKICDYHQQKSDMMKSNLEGIDAYEYIFDMLFAQTYAQMNRRTILSSIIIELGFNFDSANIVESVHNYIDPHDMIIRKGAIQAHLDQQCIIALNQRDGLLLCKGKGNEEWNYSSAHGAGRMISRNGARKKFTMKQYKDSMKNVVSSCVNLNTIDESPMAYKDTEFIKNSIGDSVEIVNILKQC